MSVSVTLWNHTSSAVQPPQSRRVVKSEESKSFPKKSIIPIFSSERPLRRLQATSGFLRTCQDQTDEV